MYLKAILEYILTGEALNLHDRWVSKHENGETRNSWGIYNPQLCLSVSYKSICSANKMVLYQKKKKKSVFEDSFGCQFSILL